MEALWKPAGRWYEAKVVKTLAFGLEIRFTDDDIVTIVKPHHVRVSTLQNPERGVT